MHVDTTSARGVQNSLGKDATVGNDHGYIGAHRAKLFGELRRANLRRLPNGETELESARFDEWFFYHDGYTPSTSRVGQRVDAERLAIVRAFGLPQVSIVEWVRRYYGHQGMTGDNLYELFSKSPVHASTRGPRTTRSRLITEDIPYGLVPLASFGRLAGVETPGMDALVTLACAVNEADYRQTGRTVETLGLGGMTRDEILCFVTGGP